MKSWIAIALAIFASLAGSTPEDMGTFLVEQLGAWGRAFRDAGMNPE